MTQVGQTCSAAPPFRQQSCQVGSFGLTSLPSSLAHPCLQLALHQVSVIHTLSPIAMSPGLHPTDRLDSVLVLHLEALQGLWRGCF